MARDAPRVDSSSGQRAVHDRRAKVSAQPLLRRIGRSPGSGGRGLGSSAHRAGRAVVADDPAAVGARERNGRRRARRHRRRRAVAGGAATGRRARHVAARGRVVMVGRSRRRRIVRGSGGCVVPGVQSVGVRHRHRRPAHVIAKRARPRRPRDRELEQEKRRRQGGDPAKTGEAKHHCLKYSEVLGGATEQGRPGHARRVSPGLQYPLTAGSSTRAGSTSVAPQCCPSPRRAGRSARTRRRPGHAALG